jgi:rhodanese-related sulfurtransferase
MANMVREMKKLYAEMAVIIVLASAIGLIVNHKLLLKVWSGKPDSVSSSESGARAVANIPLPVGLLQVKELFDRKEAVFVDARDDFLFSQGHIKGALVMPLGQSDARLAQFMNKVPVSSTLVVYCNGYNCHDSMTLGTKLMGKGYRQVYVYEGGYPEWKDASLPTEGAKP